MYGETDYKIPGLSRFLGKFAREDEKAEPEENVEIKQQQTSEEQAKKTNPSAKAYSEVSHQNFTKEVI
jgi:Sec-independent protein translocase protein TatA